MTPASPPGLRMQNWVSGIPNAVNFLCRRENRDKSSEFIGDWTEQDPNAPKELSTIDCLPCCQGNQAALWGKEGV